MAIEQRPSRVRGRTFALRGVPCKELTSLAERLKVELIVISTRGQTGLKRRLLGSTAERVVSHPDCPVYVVRSFGQNQRKPQRKD